jgi:hypothetical protein
MISEAERFDILHPALCDCLRWKGMFIGVPHDPSVPAPNDGAFWCVFTQTCVGPDGKLAEPGSCSSPSRPCHGVGRVD